MTSPVSRSIKIETTGHMTPAMLERLRLGIGHRTPSESSSTQEQNSEGLPTSSQSERTFPRAGRKEDDDNDDDDDDDDDEEVFHDALDTPDAAAAGSETASAEGLQPRRSLLDLFNLGWSS
jgi:hypothetical protein